MYYLSGSLPKSMQKSTQNGGSILNVPIAWLCHAEHVLQTGNVAHLWAFHIRRLSDWWHSLARLPLFSAQSWFIRLAAVTWHWRLPTYFSCGSSLWAHSPLFGIPMGKSIGQKHTTCTHTILSRHIHTGPVLEGRWASHCLHSERISHPEGSAAWWARGVSGSVRLPSEELVWMCMRPILAHAHIQSAGAIQASIVASLGFYDPCLPVRIFIERSTQRVKESTHKQGWCVNSTLNHSKK